MRGILRGVKAMRLGTLAQPKKCHALSNLENPEVEGFLRLAQTSHQRTPYSTNRRLGSGQSCTLLHDMLMMLRRQKVRRSIAIDSAFCSGNPQHRYVNDGECFYGYELAFQHRERVCARRNYRVCML